MVNYSLTKSNPEKKLIELNHFHTHITDTMTNVQIIEPQIIVFMSNTAQ